MKKLLCLLISATLLGSLVVAPVSGASASPTATPSTGICTCGCGLTLNKVIWQPWDPNTNGNPINGHYYLQADYVHNKQYQVNSGVRMVLDLRGHKLTSQNSRLFLVYGNTAIIDTVGGGRVCASSTGTGNGGALAVALDGVAMNDEMDATFSLYNCTATLEKGKSGLNGGLFNVGDGAKLKIYNSTLLNASANERGGAIYANKSGAVVEMTDSSIIGCKSTIAGGAIYSIGSVTLKNCKLIGNECDSVGGNLYNNGGSLTVENSTIESGISRATKDGGGNIYAKGNCRVTISDSTIRNGYTANLGGNIFFGKGTQTLTNTTISAGVSGNQGANLYCADTASSTTLNNCTISGDVYYSGGNLTLKGSTKIGLNSNGLKLTVGTVAKASALTSGAEIFVDAEGIFTDKGASQTYFKPALRTIISAESTGLKATQATTGTSGYCPHCNQQVAWTAIGATPAGHCYLTADISPAAAYSVTADTVIDLRGFDITSTDRAFTVTAGGALTLLDSVGGSTVKGSGNADKLGGVIQNAGPLRIYGGNYIYVTNSAKPLTSGGVIYATGSLYIHGGSFNGSAFNYTTNGCKGGTVYQENQSGVLTMSAGHFVGGRAYSVGNVFIGGNNTVIITGGSITGGSAVKNIGNLSISGVAGISSGSATISGLSVTDGTSGTGDAGNFTLCYYGQSQMTDCYIARGISTGNKGGNAYFTTNTRLTLTDCILLAGTATRGGNIQTTTTSTNVTLINCLITDGTATSTDGGNICCGNGIVTFRGGVIAYGSANTTGGNISNITGANDSDDTLYLYAHNGTTPLLTGGRAGTYGGNVYTTGRLFLDAATFVNGKASTAGKDLYIGSSNVAQLTVGIGVTGTVSTGITSSYLSSNVYGGTVTNTTATTLNAKIVLEGYASSPALCASDGKLCVGAATVKKTDGSENWYIDANSAMAACGTNSWVKLYVDSALELTKDCYVDLNGKIATVSGSCTLFGMDSSGDDYSVGTGKAQWASAQAVKSPCLTDAPNSNRYVAITDGASVTYHRLGIQLTHVTIRPETCGIYYRGMWGCDSMLAERIEEYGIAVSLYSMPKENFASDPNCLYASYAGTDLVSGEIKTSVLVNRIMKSDLTAKDNQMRGEMPIYSTAYVKMKDGTVLTGDRDGIEDDIAFSLRGVMETMDQMIAAEPMLFLRDAVQAGRNFYAAWKDNGMQAWSFEKLKQPEDDGILKIIILGSSRSVNTFQLLYEAFKDQMPDQEFVMGVMYYSGCSMTMHENFIKTNQPVYQYYHNSNGHWVITPGMYMADGLHAENWDVILLQAGTGDINNQMQLETRNFLKSYIDDHVIDPYELWWHSTWFNSTDPTLYKPPKTEADAAKVNQIAQLTETNNAAKAYVLNDPMFSGHITSGTPMMYALKVLDVPEVDLFRDHTHLSDFGCLLVAYSFYAQYTGKPVTQINLDTIPVYLRHRDYQSLGDMTVTDEMKQIIMDTVEYTMNNLWAVPTGE